MYISVHDRTERRSVRRIDERRQIRDAGYLASDKASNDKREGAYGWYVTERLAEAAAVRNEIDKSGGIPELAKGGRL